MAACSEQSTLAQPPGYPLPSGASTGLAKTGPPTIATSPGGGPARAGGVEPAGGGAAIPRTDPAIASLLSGALLTRFRDVRRVTPTDAPAQTVVLAPLA